MQGAFKKYAREPRINLTEEVFNLGMSFTNAPLSEGYLKELVNFDIKENGQILTPREALRVTNMINNTDPSYTFSEMGLLIGGKVSTDNKPQVLSGCVTTPIADTKLHAGRVYVSELDPDGKGTLSIKNTSPTGYKARFMKPTGAEIHGIPVYSNDYIAKNIGTYAYNGEYYYMQDKLCKINLEKTNGYEEMIPQETTPKEAVMWGYNMLADNPYSFVCSNVAGVPQILGILPFKKDGTLNLSPKINEELNLKCYWAAPQNTKYKLVWEWKDVIGTSWTKLKEEVVNTGTTLTPWAINFSSPTATVMIRLTIHNETANITTDLPLQVMAVGFNFKQEDYGSTANITTKNYTLNTATGISYWQNRLVLYGVAEDPTLIFMSEVNNPTYFPYPNSTDIFDEPIIHAVPLLDSLLVFTTNSLYMLTLTSDATSWSKSLIQSNLYIKDWDLHLIRVVKNMVFFKSGNYYYMVVPKLNSLTGELVIAPISKPITSYLDNFQDNVEKTLKKIYNYKEGVNLIHYYNYLDYEDVHNVYVFTAHNGKYINFELLYNTVGRYWRIYISENNTILKPIRQDATKKGTLVGINEGSRLGGIGVHFVEGVPSEVEDKHIVSYGIKDDGGYDTVMDYFGAEIFKNHQFIDTGYREHASDFKKRYREIQLKLNNTSQRKLSFYTSFTVDSELRKDYFKYKTVQQIDPNNPKKATLVVERDFINPSSVPSSTVLADSYDDFDNYKNPNESDGYIPIDEATAWNLDNSIFPDAIHWKIRVPVSGKGYAPRLTIVSQNQYHYELLNLAWVYRQLYSR